MPRVLLVEDSRVQAVFATRVLEAAGYDVQHVATGEEALKACYDNPPDIVLQDQHLAEMSGLEVCRRLKNDIALTAIPLAVLTAGNREKDHIAALDSGADAFLPKDSPNHELLAVVARLIKSTTDSKPVDASDRVRHLARRTRILAIDDSPTFLNMLSKKLTEAGFEVTSAASGADGLEQLDRQAFDVAIVDVVMPVMDGFEVCVKARHWATENNAPLGLLVLTGSERNDILVKALEAGADDYVTKLQDIDVILAHTAALARRIARAKQIKSLNDLTSKWQATEAAAEAKNNVLADLGNGLRTPLNEVLDVASQLRQTELSPQQQNHVDAIQQSANELQQRLNQMFDVAKAKARSTEIDDPLPDDVQHMAQPTVAEQTTEPMATPDEGEILNWQAALDRMLGREDELQELAAMFIDLYPQMMDDIRNAITNEDARSTLQLCAHSLKGSADIFDAERVVAVAGRLEKMGKVGTFDEAASEFAKLEIEVALLHEKLANHCGRAYLAPVAKDS